MEKGSNSHEKKLTSAEIAALTNATIEKIKKKRDQESHRGRNFDNGTTIKFYDLTSEDYSWLLPGWVAEERKVHSGRLYKYYYDPEGNYYKTKTKAIEILKEMGSTHVFDN